MKLTEILSVSGRERSGACTGIWRQRSVTEVLWAFWNVMTSGPVNNVS